LVPLAKFSKHFLVKFRLLGDLTVETEVHGMNLFITFASPLPHAYTGYFEVEGMAYTHEQGLKKERREQTYALAT
jgi:hypothetical protein